MGQGDDVEAEMAVEAPVLDRQHGIDQDHFRSDLDVEHAVGLLYALFAPISLTQLMRQRSLPEIADASTEFFLAGLARTP